MSYNLLFFINLKKVINHSCAIEFMQLFRLFTKNIQFTLLLLLVFCFNGTYSANSDVNAECKTAFWVKNSSVSNIELEQREKAIKFLLNNLPGMNELFNNEVNKESKNDDIKFFVKKHSIINSVLTKILERQPEAFSDVPIHAKAIFTKYCKNHKIDSKDLISKAQKQNIKESTLSYFFEDPLIKQKIIMNSLPSFMAPCQNDLEKILVPQAGYKVSDIRIVYEEFSINKDQPNSYATLLKTRARVMVGRCKKMPKNVKRIKETHYYYTSAKNWDMSFQTTLFDLSAGKVSTVFEKEDKLSFVKLINYEVLGNDKRLINQVHLYYKSLAIDSYSEKFYFDLLNYMHVCESHSST